MLLLHNLGNFMTCCDDAFCILSHWPCLQYSADDNENYPLDTCVQQVSSSLQYESQPFEQHSVDEGIKLDMLSFHYHNALMHPGHVT